MTTVDMHFNAMDPASLGDLQRFARDGNSPEALREAARQFEGLFLQMVLKAMRDATPQDGMFDSEQTRFFQSLHDQQLALDLARRGGVGLADELFRQLGGEDLVQQAVSLARRDGAVGNPRDLQALRNLARGPAISAALPASPEVAAGAAPTDSVEAANRLIADISAALEVSGTRERDREAPAGAREFVDRVWPHAVEASKATGIPPHFLVAQAALETGWGKAELRRADGTPSHNLFNIKAGRRWSGETVALSVTEYANGGAYTEKARFRVYDSYQQGFRDYADMLRGNPRYASVLDQQDAASFAQGLQKAGYATDPLYADKLTRIIDGATLRGALPG